MNDELFLLKLGEIVLKGLNRRRFEERLMGNLHRRLYPYGRFRTYSRQSIIYVEPLEETCDLDGAWESLQKLFGVVALSRAKACDKDPDAFFRAACTYLDGQLRGARTFKVESKRSDKTFPMTSIELSQYVGGLLDDAYPNLTVDVHNPELIVHLEVRDFAGYVHANAQPGAGGLPVGAGGRAVALLSGGIDSPVACYMMAKRGLALEMIHFFSYPYTSNEAKEKVLELAGLLTGYCGRLTVNIVPFTAIQEELRRSCPEPYFTLAMRRFMMRISELVADRVGADAIVTGESLGQVASQTIQAIACTDAVATMPVFRPLIGADKSEIVKVAYQIGTYDISIEPYEDCCTIFTPKHPRTKPILHFVEDGERAIEGEALLEEALAQMETEWVYPR